MVDLANPAFESAAFVVRKVLEDDFGRGGKRRRCEAGSAVYRDGAARALGEAGQAVMLPRSQLQSFYSAVDLKPQRQHILGAVHQNTALRGRCRRGCTLQKERGCKSSGKELHDQPPFRDAYASRPAVDDPWSNLLTAVRSLMRHGSWPPRAAIPR